jgi:Mor family transcriptional regulator
MDIARVVAESVQVHAGLTEAVANSVGMLAAERLSFELGGKAVYFSKELSILKRHREIYRDYHDNNYAALAEKYGYTESYVRRVVARMHREAMAGAQPGLFDGQAA